MAQESPADVQILEKIGLSDSDLRDLQTKHYEFIKGLNPAQKQSLTHSSTTAKEAAATLGTSVTPDALEKFIRTRAPHGASMVIFNRGSKS